MHLVQILFLIFLLQLIQIANATVFIDPSQLIQHNYDFVIVGGGAAGNVIANRLSECTDVSVLVIEAGGSNQGVLSSIVPFFAPTNVPASLTTWNTTTVPQVGLYNRTVSYPRGRILGGGSSINFMTYTRGANSEYDRWARLSDNPLWAWDNVEEYYLKSEHLAPPADNHDTTGQVNPTVHRYGPIGVSVPGFPLEIDAKVIAASAELGGKFTFNLDMQSGSTLGVGIMESSIENSRRVSSATAYLEPALNRSNLDVLINTHVTRIIQTDSSKPLHFSSVEFAQSSGGKRYTVSVNKEIILSAGAIGTPQILMLSGIGDRKELESNGIKCIVHSPDVGQHLQDHPLVPNYFVVNSTNTFDTIFRNSTRVEELLQQWNTTGQGWFADSPANSLGFIRVNETVFRGVPDPSAGPGASHLEIIFIDGFAAADNVPPTTGNYITVYTAVVNPLSFGSVTITSSDPFVAPDINPGFLSNEVDVFVMVEAVKTVREFVGAKAWQNNIISRFGELTDAETDEDIANAIRRSAVTTWHPTCTCRMSPDKADWGVVDSNLVLKHVTGVRVVDASVFPVIPAVHTMAPVYILAERAADLIKQFWKL